MATSASIDHAKHESQETHKQQHTLEEFATEHFRPPPKNKLGKLVGGKREAVLWSHSHELLRQPLLKNLLSSQQLAQEACRIFEAILWYMGDFPGKKAKYKDNEPLTDRIFEAALKSEPLHDELYCQIIKQLTNNRNGLSEERGWELMWLMTGLFGCSKLLMAEVNQILRTSTHSLAPYCVDRLKKTVLTGARRYPPHLVEVETVQHKTMHTYHKVYLPDDTEETFEVDSRTKAVDIVHSVSQKLRLSSSEGFSLFVKIFDRVISVPEREFFFDFVWYITKWMFTNRPTKDGNKPILYQVFFMKKLWTYTIPGKDWNADLIFHYHQELPKLLRGYHMCTIGEAAELAGLILRVRFDNNADLGSIPRLLKDLVPADLLQDKSAEEWKRDIVAAYRQHEEKSPDDAKVAFLKIMCEWPTFGSAFFEIKQTSLENLPQSLLVAINKDGVTLFDTGKKEPVIIYPFTRISTWSSGETYFQMIIGDPVKGQKVICETALGYKMDDLLTSYTSQMSRTR